MQDDLVPSSDWIRGLIEEIYAKGVPLSDYPPNRRVYDLTSLPDSLDGVNQW